MILDLESEKMGHWLPDYCITLLESHGVYFAFFFICVCVHVH